MFHRKIAAALILGSSIALATPANASLALEDRDMAGEALATAEPAQVSDQARPAGTAKVVRVKRLAPVPARTYTASRLEFPLIMGVAY